MKEYDFKADVCIVGAGPAGALLAYILAGHNISTILVERHENINKEFRGEHLNETGEAILRKYGLFEELEKIGLLRMERVEYWNEGGVFKRIFPDSQSGHVGIHVPQKHLLGLLLEKSQPLPAFTLLLNTKVSGLIEENGQCAGVTAIKDGKEVTIKSPLVVGADGRFSTVRKLAQIPFEKIKHGYDLLWARIPAPKGWDPTVRLALVNHEQLALFTQQGGFVQIGWNIAEGSYSELRQQSFQPFLDQLIAAFPELEESARSHIRSWEDFVLLQVQSSRCDTWVKKGLVIIGDAAHTMSPTGAIGINSAMKDADTLFQLMNEMDSIEDLSLIDLQRFEQMRRQEVEEQQKFQLEKEASFGKQFIPV
ncbi:FAD-dependent monooxygenase [Bacillus benzoevorans]|uniref:2-polyprenyl-6-methoxyphenol hydroxylase-like FAD-dependent oxidoreductase n=1 Tax=Bacillus benzoevorans TaxID=1456 RepID=A0A7X0HSV4_9BACI|nr:2-polyprenyl-6-methoxyphenol hydroxylase-like FAD-dependent oxidoreductase [Bacillus benzoevorans]